MGDLNYRMVGLSGRQVQHLLQHKQTFEMHDKADGSSFVCCLYWLSSNSEQARTAVHLSGHCQYPKRFRARKYGTSPRVGALTRTHARTHARTQPAHAKPPRRARRTFCLPTGLVLDQQEYDLWHGFYEPPKAEDFYPTYKKHERPDPPIDFSQPDWPYHCYRTLYKEPQYKGGKWKERVPGWCDRILLRHMKPLDRCVWARVLARTAFVCLSAG